MLDMVGSHRSNASPFSTPPEISLGPKRWVIHDDKAGKCAAIQPGISDVIGGHLARHIPPGSG